LNNLYLSIYWKQFWFNHYKKY